MRKTSSGFTIVELLVVIVVIAILAAITVVAYNGIQVRARDSQRLQDIKSIEKALRIYLVQNGSFFSSQAAGQWDHSNMTGGFLTTLVSSGTVSKVPLDPTNTGYHQYYYYYYGAGTGGCSADKGNFAVLVAGQAESSASAFSASPGFQCSGRNWGVDATTYGTAAYVVGIFENG
jgi:prepilin-type N-terminal cleavage/methylation domain-containing protein